MAKILLVEDDNNLREIYEARLQAEGYDIVSARDGEEALTVAMKERPDLIISDVMMPKISGFDMLDIIRSTEETKDAKVIMMTALSQAEDKQRAEKLGADRYLVKSQVTLEDVAKVAREVLGGESAPAKSTDTPAQTKTEEAATPAPAPAADTPTPVPAPEPTSTTSLPAPTPAPLPTTDDTSKSSDPASTPADQSQAPAATAPATEDTSNIAMTSVTATDDKTDDKTSGSDQKTEENAIAEQIESFLDTKSGASEKAQATEAPQPETPQPTPETAKTEEADEQTPQSDTEKVKKKVIAPINDPHASSAPDLEKLAEKEKEKEEMQQIANDIAAGNTPQLTSQPDTTSQPTDAPKPEPTIPHDKGTSIDGVVQPQASSPEVKAAPQEQPASSDNKSKVDPNSIAL